MPLKKYTPAILAFVLAVLVLAVYWQTAGFGFITLDDTQNVYKNPLITSGISPGSVIGAFSSEIAGRRNVTPLTSISLMADVSMSGLSPGAMHRTNFLLHCAGAVTLFLFLRSATGSLWKSFFAAALWALHPLRVESVAWVTERKDVLSGLFFILALWSYLLYTRTRRPRWYAALVLCMVLGVLAKPVVVVLPAALLLLDFWPLGRFPKSFGKAVRKESLLRVKGLLTEKVPVIALSLAFTAITLYFNVISASNLMERSFSYRFASAATSYWKYLGRTFFPSDLILSYDTPGSSGTALAALLSLAALIAASVVAYRLRRTAPEAAFGWFWYLLILFPNSGILPLGLQSFADRYTNLPHIGLMTAFVWGAARLVGKIESGEKMLAVPGAAAVVVLTALSFTFTGHWKNSYTLFGHIDRVYGGKNVVALTYLADASMEDQNPAMALGYVERLLKCDYYTPEAEQNKVFLLKKLGRHEEAKEYLRRITEPGAR